jgi:nitrogen fixation protein FixH
MTFNFGHKLLLAFILFGILMFYMVYQSLHTNFELVSKDYYQDELAYQQVIDATKNANDLGSKTVVYQKGPVVYLQLPAEMANQSVSGNAYFYCPADAKKDRTIALALNPDGLQEILIGKEITNGNYQVRVTWTANEKKYYQDNYLQVK